MNSTDTQNQCITTKDSITITTGVIGVLLLISELLPYFKPRNDYNGLIQSILSILQKINETLKK
jgi:hypothetical protein